MRTSIELRQGKCTRCRVAFKWPARRMKLRNAYCPDCRKKLQQTTHQLKWQWVAVARPATHAESAFNRLPGRIVDKQCLAQARFDSEERRRRASIS